MRVIVAFLVLALVPAVAYTVPVDLNAPNGVAAQFVESWIGGSRHVVLCADGTIITARYRDRVQISLDSYLGEFPFPLSESVDWTPQHGNPTGTQNYISLETVILRNGQVWINEGGWYMLPPVTCAGPVQDDKSTLGKVKSLFR